MTSLVCVIVVALFSFSILTSCSVRQSLVKLEQDTTRIEREANQPTGRISINIFCFKYICVARLFLSCCSQFFVVFTVIAPAAAERMFAALSASFADLRARPSHCPCFRLALLRSFAVVVSLVSVSSAQFLHSLSFHRNVALGMVQF